MKNFLILLLFFVAPFAFAKLHKVNPKKVCMIQNTLYEKEQTPVTIEKDTFYACCSMCKERLNSDPESRFAIDPISGNKVKKSSAVIGANDNGNVFYFESDKNLNSFAKKIK
jgi:YHS domain-containing protein